MTRFEADGDGVTVDAIWHEDGSLTIGADRPSVLGTRAVLRGAELDRFRGVICNGLEAPVQPLPTPSEA